MNKRLFYGLLIIGVIMFPSCGDSASDKNDDLGHEEETQKLNPEQNKFNAQNVFNSLPDHKIVLQLIEDNKIEYNPDILNDPTAVEKYSTEFYKGINLGIYGSDLNIASSFDQTQESMVFLKCVNMLAGNLGVASAFDQKMFERIDANKNQKDSILQIVTNAFKKVDEILKNNNRPATSAVILTGCWVEGLYVSCQIANSGNFEDIVRTIVAQKESLRNVIVMIKAVDLEEPDKFIVTDLEDLHKSFEVASTAAKFDNKVLTDITKKITALRAKVITVN